MFTKTSPIRIIWLLITACAVVACIPGTEPATPAGEPSAAPCPTLTPVAVIYNGLALPTPMPNTTPPPDPNNPEPSAFIDLQPPPVWLIVGDEAVLATYGSNEIYRCGGGGHGDAVHPREMGDRLATAALPAEAQAVIVVGSEAITKFQATVQPWSELPAGQFFDASSGRPLKAEGKREADVTVYTLEPTGDAGDQLLAVSIRFDVGDAYPGGAGAAYLWRLNPVGTP